MFIEPFSFFSITGWGIDLDYCDIEWFVLETNRDHSVVFRDECKEIEEYNRMGKTRDLFKKIRY